jgi:hypothetical protein
MMRRPLVTPAQRTLLLSLCTAAWGLAVAMSTYEFWLKPAPPGQLPGYMTKEGLDAHASFRFFFMLVILPIVASYAMRPVVALLSRADARTWARNAVMASLLTACWYVSVARQDVLWTAVPSLIGAVVFTLLRRADLRFTRRDLVLVPTYAAVALAVVDMGDLPVERVMIIAAALLMAVRIGVVFVSRASSFVLRASETEADDGTAHEARSTKHEARSSSIAPAYAFALSPLALFLQTHYLSRDERYAGWPVLLIALGCPFLLRVFVRNTPVARRRIRAAVTLIVFPIAAMSYVSAVSLYTAEGRQRVDLFEDSHHLSPGWEIAHGKKPYTDIVPMHGLIDDALLDAALFRWGKPQIGNVLKTRGTIASLIAPSIYFVVFAATGSAEAGIVALFATVAMGFNIGGVRFVPSIIVLAIAIFAVRRRSARALTWAGGMTVIAGLTALDSGFYSAVITVAAMLCFRSGPDRWKELKRAFVAVTIGVVSVFGVAIIGMAIGGYAMDFFRVTLTEIANLGPVYSLRPMGGVPPAFDRQFPEIFTAMFDPRGVQYLTWPVAMAFVALCIAYGFRGAGRARRRIEPLFLCALFIVVHGVSYAERQHVYFHFVIPATVVIASYILLRRRSSSARFLGVFLALTIVMLANLTIHAAIDTYLRRVHGPLDPGWTVVGLPAAQNALFHEDDIKVIDTVHRWCLAHLGPEDTFYDFTDHTVLHILLERRIPVRQIEVATCEPERLQREVISRLAHNPHVKAVIVSNDENSGVDNVPNWKRVPLVWQWIQQNFQPDFSEGKVVIWKRRV